jgi:urease accessory protein
LPAETPTRPLRIGIAGPVGTGKSSLIAALCRELSGELELAVVTNDIYTDEDARFLRSAGVLAPERITAVQTGCCPHTAIRDDISANLQAVEDLESAVADLSVTFVESGGDNLTACFSPALIDTQIFVLDCAGGDDVPRKGGPGVERSDLLVINKVDLAPYVGADVSLMLGDATERRDGRPVLALSLRDPADVRELAGWVYRQLSAWRERELVAQDPGPPAPHGDSDHDHPGTVHCPR